MFDFIKDIGAKIFGSKEEAPEKLKEHIEQDNPGVENLEVQIDDEGKVSLSGEAKDTDALQKAVLMAGNVEGVSEVDPSGVVVQEEKEIKVEIYEIQKGDTLWAIAERFYGDGNKWKKIFEDNREVIKDPDLIYPGQKIRIVLED
ncbi:MAG: peptidoglycan-binding protein LysM [Epsilonproteobacteria bacterium]|nr:peptidoglycan-binding protein LysM [Campylobacterota bacterium]NPA56906.1 peptidoglycan-binding protein LysM [Campylobacterota bacterium]